MSYQKLAIFERLTPRNDLERTGGNWQVLFRAFVDIKPLRGNEFLVAQGIESRITHRVWTYWRDGVTSRDRLKITRNQQPKPNDPNHESNFRIFNIESVINVGERNRELELMVVERA